MKNNLLKYYIAAFYLCATFITFAQPADTGDGTGGLEGTVDSTPAAPIDERLWVLVLVGLVFVFMKYRTMQNKRVNS